VVRPDTPSWRALRFFTSINTAKGTYQETSPGKPGRPSVVLPAQPSPRHAGSSSVLVHTRGPSARHAWDQLEIDLLEAPQAPATPLSRSSGLAPQPACFPASPKVTMTQEVLAMCVQGM
jgi:hypothetical protein